MTAVLDRPLTTQELVDVDLPEPKPTTGLVVMFGLIALSAFTVLHYSLSSRTGLVQVLQWALMLGASVRIGVLVGQRRPRYALLTFWLFVYVIFGFVQVVQLSTHRNPFLVTIPDTQMAHALALLLVGSVAFDLASSVAFSRERTPTAGWRVLDPKRVVALSVVSLVLFPVFVSGEGGLGSLFTSRLAVASTGEAGNSAYLALLVGAANVLPIAALYSLLLLWKRAVNDDNRMLYVPLLVAVIAENVCLNNPVSQPRYWMATIVVGAMLVSRAFHRAGWRAFFVVFFVLATAIAFPYLDAFRYTGPSQTQVHRQAITYFFDNKTDYGTSTDLENTLTYVEVQGHTDGRQVLGAALFFVPRSVWPGKPEDTAALIARQIHFPNQNIDSPLWAEGYIDAGLPGVVLLLAGFGYAFGSAERRWLATRDLPHGTWRLLFPLLVGYELLLIRGSLLQSMGRLSFLLVVFALIGARQPPGERP